jgi:hypothetical protein
MRSLAGTKVVPRLLADGPRQEWRVGLLTFVVGEQRAELRYARESVGWARPHAPEIVAALRRAVDRLLERSLAPDELLPRLGAAYAAVLTREARRPDARVSLVELRDELAKHRDLRSRPYTRAQFAWDLARLRREQRLVVDGRRIDLGIATGHAATRRSRVVWIENDRGGGAFYESFRLIAQETA